MDRIIMHIDVNNAFLSWTALLLLKDGYTTDIRKIDAIIGGDEANRHGIVLAKSMSAKRKGVKTAMPIWEAKRKCYNLAIFSPNYKWYSEMSSKLFELIRHYTPDIEILSIDECFLDYTPVRNLYGDPLLFAHKLKDEILNKLGFTVNIGVAQNKLCAKMASDFTKPNRVHTLYNNEVETKMYPLDVSELYGIGKSSSAKLHELHINTIGDLASCDELWLSKYFKNRASIMVNHARGIDNSLVISDTSENKGISHSTTLPYNFTKLEQIYSILQILVENIAVELRSYHKYCYVIGVTLKDKYFKSSSHQRKLKNATNQTKEIYDVAKDLVNELWNDEPIRLVGISLTNLVNQNYYQVSLFENVIDNEAVSKLDETLDNLKKQYGSNIIKTASSVDHNIKKKY